jgi:ProP effector
MVCSLFIFKDKNMIRPHKKAIEALNALKHDLPFCFKRGNEKQPIAIGIHHDVLAHYAHDSRFSKTNLREAISLYAFATEYLKKIREGSPRINLLGQETSHVTKEEEENARTLLLKRKGFGKTVSEATKNVI